LKVKLQISNADGVLYEAVHDIRDEKSFGSACSEAWEQLRAQRLEKATSIGSLYEILNDSVLDLLLGAKITFEKIS
jgi:hypothetical protein